MGTTDLRIEQDLSVKNSPHPPSLLRLSFHFYSKLFGTYLPRPFPQCSPLGSAFQSSKMLVLVDFSYMGTVEDVKF